MDPNTVSESIILYIGRGLKPSPSRDIERLAERFGALEAADLALIVTRLEDEYYEVEPEPHETLNDAADRAKATFSASHPELSTAAIEALDWCYSYDWK